MRRLLHYLINNIREHLMLYLFLWAFLIQQNKYHCRMRAIRQHFTLTSAVRLPLK